MSKMQTFRIHVSTTTHTKLYYLQARTCLSRNVHHEKNFFCFSSGKRRRCFHKISAADTAAFCQFIRIYTNGTQIRLSFPAPCARVRNFHEGVVLGLGRG